jgi:hypothetical protein
VTIEAVRDLMGRTAFDLGRFQDQTAQAIESLRHAIVQLRSAQTEEMSVLALGFVAGEPVAGRGQPER